LQTEQKPIGKANSKPMKDGNSKLQQILKTKKNKLKTVHRERENPPRNLKIKWKNRVGYGRNHEKN